MSGLIESLAWVEGALAQALLHSAVMVVLLLVLRALLRDRIPARVYALGWLLVMLRLALPAVPGTPLSVYALGDALTATPAAAISMTPETVTVTTAAEVGPVTTAVAEDAWTAGLPTTVLLGLWLAGALAVLLLSLWRHRALARLLRNGRSLRDDGLNHLAEECRQAMGVRTPIRLVEVDGIGLPAVVGWFRPRLLVSLQQVSGLSEFQWRCVLLHEMAHLRRRDLWFGGLVTLVQAVHWFNPFAWLAARCWREDRELAADALALRVLGPERHRDFGGTLITVLDSNRLRRATAPSAAFLPSGWNGLRRRISVLAKFRGESHATTALATLGIAVLATVTMTDCIEAEPVDGPEPVAASKELTPGVELFDTKRFKEAAVFFDQAAAELPDESLREKAAGLAHRTRSVEAAMEVGTDRLKQRNFEEAVPALKRAAEVARTVNAESPVVEEIETRRLAPALVLHGNTLLKREDYAGAYAAFQTALGLKPSYAPAQKGLTKLSHQAKKLYFEGYVAKYSDPETARKKWRLVIRITGPDDEWHIKALERLAGSERPEPVRSYARPSPELAGDATDAAGPGLDGEDSGAAEQQADLRKLYYEAYVAKYSGPDMAKLKKWRQAQEMTDADKEWHAKALKRLAEVDRPLPSPHDAAPVPESSESGPDSTSRRPDSAAAAAPGEPGDREKAKALYVEATKHHQKHELEQAIALYRKALDADGRFAYALRGMGIALASQGKGKEACEAYRSYLEISPLAPDRTQVRTILQGCND